MAGFGGDRRGDLVRKKSGKPRRKAPRPPDPGRFVHHPKYGDVPLVPWTHTAPDGSTRELWRYDPAYQPPLPPGAVRGDIRKQVYCCDFPQYFYQDIRRGCVQCKQPFTFHAAEQKFWYETLQFNFASTAVRCTGCRKQRRSAKALHEQMAQALAAVKLAPEEPGKLLALAEATAQFHERLNAGNLDRGIAAARKARRRAPELDEARFWEGELLALAGRKDAAREVLRPFLERMRASGAVPHRRLIAAAEKRLQELDRAP